MSNLSLYKHHASVGGLCIQHKGNMECRSKVPLKVYLLLKVRDNNRAVGKDMLYATQSKLG